MLPSRRYLKTADRTKLCLVFCGGRTCFVGYRRLLFTAFLTGSPVTAAVALPLCAIGMGDLTDVAAGIAGFITIGTIYMGCFFLGIGTVQATVPMVFGVACPAGGVHMPGIGHKAADHTLCAAGAG